MSTKTKADVQLTRVCANSALLLIYKADNSMLILRHKIRKLPAG